MNNEANTKADELLRGFRHIGKCVTIYPSAQIINRQNISLANKVKIDDFVFFDGGEDTQIGNYVHISPFCLIAGGGRLVMKDFSGISAGVRVHTGTDDFSGDSLVNPTVPKEFRFPKRSFVVLEKHATICSGSTVLPGVTIGEGTVVGAHSLVTSDCEPWSVYVGSPAKKIKDRPRDNILRMESEIISKYFTDGVYSE